MNRKLSLVDPLVSAQDLHAIESYVGLHLYEDGMRARASQASMLFGKCHSLGHVVMEGIKSSGRSKLIFDQFRSLCQ